MLSRLTILAVVVLLAAPAIAAEPGEPARFNVGRAQEKITPPVGVSLAGYFHDRKGESVRDDLYARAVVLESGGERLALVSCDLICLTEEVVDAARGLIAAETAIAADHVMLCATHTHTGPELRADSVVPRDDAWVAGLPRQIADCVATAAASMTPATLRAGSIDVTGYSFNRLFRQKDGSELFGRREGELGPAGPIDPQLQTLSAVGEDGKLLAVLVNFALHVDVIGGGGATMISADWPGVMADTISRVYGGEVVTMLAQGTCGDINHVPHDPTALPRGGPAKAEQIGRALAGAAMAALERAEPMRDGRIAVIEKTLEIPYYTRDESFMAELAALKKKETLSGFEKYTIERGETWSHDNQTAKVPLQVMRIGEIGLVALPAEIFVAIGLEIKRWAPTPTFVVELANGRVTGYVPTTDQAERGAYGAKPILSRWLCSDAGRRLADAALVMLQELK
ncbi:MAG TPA: neutral/alkaline non-lysosomal ceramidase N-terminal domain-containing protein [Candidatus Bathyarchaeia archaeon]|nr:neutral/alkaline non-lysosomal ceramidase N-terminal domain-containing protein [Candidatus Bathyarchaeia archaeon]